LNRRGAKAMTDDMDWMDRGTGVYQDYLLVGFDLAETKIFERVGKADGFMAKLSLTEAKMMRDRLEEQTERMENRDD